MSAKWKWGAVSIYVREAAYPRELKIAELNPLDSTTSTIHFFGAGSQKISVTGLVVGNTDKAQIISDATNHTQRDLTTPWATETSYHIIGTPNFKPILYAGATIDGTSYQPDVTPVYECELELINA
jgi:hypothetical protein